MANETINIGICLDRNVLLAAEVLLTSIKAHSKPARPVKVFALTDFDSPELRRFAEAQFDTAFELVPIRVENLCGSLPSRDYITHGTYLRFLMPDLLRDVAKIIYLDTDVIVDHDLAPLFDIDLQGHALAAMPDYAMLVGSRTWSDYWVPFGGRKYRFADYALTVLKLDAIPFRNYFNCGVMLIDLHYWRTHDVAGRTIDCLVQNPDLFLMDQDALNVLMNGSFLPLDARWNAFASCSQKAFIGLWLTSTGRRWEAIRAQWRRDPWIIHYAGANKPWARTHPRTPHDGIWWKYARLSPVWAELEPVYMDKEVVGRGKAQSRR